MEEQDEILAPKGCARCGHAFLPGPDRLAFCPRCHAPHHGLTIPANAQGPYLVDAWLRANGVSSPVEYAPMGFALHRTGGKLFVILTAQAMTTSGGYSVIIERGMMNNPQNGPPYTIVRLAGFAPNPTAPTMPSTGLGNIATPRRSDCGLELVATSGILAQLRMYGVAAALSDLETVARACGLEPIHALRDATLTEIPPEVAGELGRGERTVRCESCGAPAALRLLAHAPETRCPYCTATVRVHPELAHELEGHRRRMRAQDAMHVLDPERLWTAWHGATDEDRLACAVCGAPSAHRPGALDERCGHCGAMIVPSAERLEQDAAHARQIAQHLAARREDSRRRAKARTRQISSRATALNLGLFLLGGLIAVATSAGVAFRRGAGLDTETLVFVGLPLFAYVVVPGAIVVYLITRTIRQGERWASVFTRLAEQLDGVLLTKDERAGWLRRWWSSPTRESQMYGPSGAAGAIAVQVQGLEVLLDADAEGNVGIYRSAYGRSWVSLLIATSWTRSCGLLKTTTGVRQRRAAIERAGFTTVIRRAGFEIQASPATILRLKKHPASAAVLVPVLYEALRVTQLLGVQPPRPRG